MKDKTEATSNNFFQVVPNSQSFDNIGQIIAYVKNKEAFDRDYLLIGLENTKKNGYDLEKLSGTSTHVINQLIMNDKVDKNLISDGYHTFADLYSHRVELFISLCKSLLRMEGSFYEDKIYKTRFDFENKYCGDGWFIMGIDAGKGKQISYHLSMDYWEQCSFIKSVDKVPNFDGHTSADVIERLKKLI